MCSKADTSDGKRLRCSLLPVCSRAMQNMAVTALYVPPPFLPSSKHTNCRSSVFRRRKIWSFLCVLCLKHWCKSSLSVDSQDFWERKQVILLHGWEDWLKQKLTELSKTTQQESDEGRALPPCSDNLLWPAKAAFILLILWCGLKCSRSMHSVPAWRSKLPSSLD